MTTKEILIGIILSFGIPLVIIILLWLNSIFLERERKLILAGKKEPWGHRRKK